MICKTQFTFDTKLSADSVEWCPRAGFEDYLAVGTYQVEKSNKEVFGDSQRSGRIYLFKEEKAAFEVFLIELLKTPMEF
jgi:hypothetical protein